MPRKILIAVMLLVLAIAWAVLKGRGGDGAGGGPGGGIPASVFGGGAATLTIEATASAPARVTAVFEGDELLETHQDVPAGTHTFTVDVPANVSGIVEVGIDNPDAGTRVELVCRVNGEFVGRDGRTLDVPLEEGYAFFAQIAFDDFARGELSTD